MDRAIHTPAAQKRAIGRVDDDIHYQCRDVALYDRKPLAHLRPPLPLPLPLKDYASQFQLCRRWRPRWGVPRSHQSSDPISSVLPLGSHWRPPPQPREASDMLPMPKGTGLLSSFPQISPRVPEGPARPSAYCWPRAGRGPAPARRWDRPRCACTSACVCAPTAAPLLAGAVGRDRDHVMPGACCLGFKEATERRPAGSTDALGQVVVPHPSGDPHVFQRAGVVLPEQRQRRLVVDILALASHLLVLLGQHVPGLVATPAALLAPTHPLLRLGQPPRCPAGVPRVLPRRALCRHEHHLPAD